MKNKCEKWFTNKFRLHLLSSTRRNKPGRTVHFNVCRQYVLTQLTKRKSGLKKISRSQILQTQTMERISLYRDTFCKFFCTFSWSKGGANVIARDESSLCIVRVFAPSVFRWCWIGSCFAPRSILLSPEYTFQIAFSNGGLHQSVVLSMPLRQYWITLYLPFNSHSCIRPCCKIRLYYKRSRFWII